MQERAQRIGAKLSLRSAAGEGTTVEVRLERKTAERGVR